MATRPRDQIATHRHPEPTHPTPFTNRLLEKVKESGPDEVELKFGVKVSGTMNWLVARAASEGNFEITLTWKPEPVRVHEQ